MVTLAKNKILTKTVAATWMHFDTAPVIVEVGLSGGVDSVVLTHLLSTLQTELNFTLIAVYVHHGLSKNADAWAQFCSTFCAQLGISFRQQVVMLDRQSSLGLEAEAREKRYQVYASSAAQIIALAHHNDDLCETILLNLLRGGGVHSLAAMPVWRFFADKKQLWRPLLGITKAQLLEFAQENQLTFVEDESNADSKFRRNYLRNIIFPQLQAHIPYVQQHFQRTASLMQDAAAILDEVALMDLTDIVQAGAFDCTRWRKLSFPRQKQALLRFAIEQNLGAPRPDSLLNFCAQLNQSTDSQLQWQLPHGNIYAYQDQLFVCHFERSAFAPVLVSSFKNVPFDNRMLIWKLHEYGLSEDILKSGLILKSRQGGEMIALNVGRKSVKKILQEAKIPPFLRKCWPLLFTLDNQCVAVTDICVSIEYGHVDGYLPCQH